MGIFLKQLAEDVVNLSGHDILLKGRYLPSTIVYMFYASKVSTNVEGGRADYDRKGLFHGIFQRML